MRKLFSLFLVLVATTSLWAYDFQSGDLYYKITSSSAPYTVEVIDAEWSITSPIIPETVTYNGITYSVTSIGNHAFRECTSLTSVTIPNSVTSIGYKAFYECTSLTSVTIGNSVTSIGDEAFALCFSITSVTIPNSVTSIGDYTFEGCSSLTSITIPNSVISIGRAAFERCSSLTSITCLGTTPPDANDLAVNTSTCKLIVPYSAYNAYLRHAYWGQFLNIVPSSEMESSAPEVYVNPANPAQKLLRNGQVYILKDDKTYTIMGAQIQ